MKKSTYDRSSGRTADESVSPASKSAHLSAARDPFKPRQSDWLLAILFPWAVYCYCWKRAALPLSALLDYAGLYSITGLCYVLCTLPSCMINNRAESAGMSMESRPGFVDTELYRVWPWYKYVRLLYLLPYALQIVLALKAWYRARKVTHLAVERAELRDVDPATFDVDRQLYTFEPRIPFASFLNDLLGMRLKASELDLHAVLQPPSAADVGGEEELEDAVLPMFLPLLACWYGPMRPFNMALSLVLGIAFHFIAEVLTLLLGWLVAFFFLWSKESRPTFGHLMDYFRPVFFGGLWSCLYTIVPLGVILAVCVMFYRVAKRTGVLLQLSAKRLF